MAIDKKRHNPDNYTWKGFAKEAWQKTYSIASNAMDDRLVALTLTQLVFMSSLIVTMPENRMLKPNIQVVEGLAETQGALVTDRHLAFSAGDEFLLFERQGQGHEFQYVSDPSRAIEIATQTAREYATLPDIWAIESERNIDVAIDKTIEHPIDANMMSDFYRVGDDGNVSVKLDSITIDDTQLLHLETVQSLSEGWSLVAQSIGDGGYEDGITSIAGDVERLDTNGERFLMASFTGFLTVSFLFGAVGVAGTAGAAISRHKRRKSFQKPSP